MMISRMAKPEQVLVVENEQGEVVREFMKDTDAINMRERLGEGVAPSSLVLFTCTSSAPVGRPALRQVCYCMLCAGIM